MTIKYSAMKLKDVKGGNTILIGERVKVKIIQPSQRKYYLRVLIDGADNQTLVGPERNKKKVLEAIEQIAQALILI